MRMILLQLGLALSLLARGPLCDVLCDPVVPEVEAAVASPHGSAGEAPCHEMPANPANGAGNPPTVPHDACANCDDLLLAATSPPPAATWLMLGAPGAVVRGSPGQPVPRRIALPSSSSGRPEPPDILLQKSTLLI